MGRRPFQELMDKMTPETRERIRRIQEHIPNQATRETLEKTDRGEDLHEYAGINDFFREMSA